MNDVRNFIKDIENIFSINSKGKQEKRYLERLNVLIEEYASDYPNTTYDELSDKFGTPKDIYMNYLETVDSDYMLKKIKTRRIIKISCIIALSVLFLLGLWKGYLIYQDSKESESQRPTHIEITSPEEISNEKISD